MLLEEIKDVLEAELLIGEDMGHRCHDAVRAGETAECTRIEIHDVYHREVLYVDDENAEDGETTEHVERNDAPGVDNGL